MPEHSQKLPVSRWFIEILPDTDYYESENGPYVEANDLICHPDCENSHLTRMSIPCGSCIRNPYQRDNYKKDKK